MKGPFFVWGPGGVVEVIRETQEFLSHSIPKHVRAHGSFPLTEQTAGVIAPGSGVGHGLCLSDNPDYSAGYRGRPDKSGSDFWSQTMGSFPVRVYTFEKTFWEVLIRDITLFWC